MPSTRIELINKKGLHARAAASLASRAGEFDSELQVRCPDHEAWVDGKSVMSLMLLAATCGTELELRAEGPDAEAALEALCELIRNRFDEGE